MTIPTFELGGIPIPIEAGSATAKHEYRTSSRLTDLPMADNSIRRQIYAGSQRKLVVRISSSDMPAPAGVASLDPAQDYTLKCGAIRTISGLTNSIALPVTRRADAGYEPRGWAQVAGRRVSTPVSIVGDDATLDSVNGATGYGVDFYPEIIGLVDFEDESDRAEGKYSWTLTIREK